MLGLIRRNAQFRLFWIGQTASMLGNYALPVALALFAALHFRSVSAVGLVLAARALGSVIMLLIGGALADMWDRRKLMIVSDVARLLLVAVLATSPGSLSLTVLVCLLLGCGEGLFYPAYNAFTVELVPPEDRQSANSLNSIGVQTAAVAAPALAAVVVAWSGTTLLFVVDALTFAVSLVTLVAVRRAVEPRPAGEGAGLRALGASIIGGFQEIRKRRWIGFMIGQDAVNTGFAYGPVAVLLPLLLLERGHGPAVFAAIAAFSAAGSIVGGFLGSLVKTRSPGIWACVLASLFAAYTFAIALGAPPGWLMALAAISSMGSELGLVLWYTSLQRDVPESMLSRINSVDWTGSMSLRPIGQAATGPVAALVGSSPLLLGAGVVVAVTTLLPLLSADVRAFRTSSTKVEAQL
ncbi:MFS transporter [Actinoplanes sp. NPDC051343]|uniref:MFS transporter n=1 Tax=Actinoplanes sp. NPDC051343 TaxID=3363906 RepID=UPI00379B42B5